MDRYVVLEKNHFSDFIEKLSLQKKVVAPVAQGYNTYSFEEIKSAKEISLKYIPTILPPKKYFMPPKEKILSFNKKEHSWTPVLEYDQLVLFGVHTCDLAGIQCLNMVFTTKPKDVNYIIRKDKILIIGLECNDYCDEYASCKIVDNHLPNGGYDLFFTELDDCFIVHVNTLDGEQLVKDVNFFTEARDKHFQALDALREKKRKIFQDEVNVRHQQLKPLFDKSHDSKVWEDVGNRCVSCGNCTNVCPTCYCFDIQDDIELDLNAGARYRVWDSCQNEEFAKVAGNENFREERLARQRHRYLRKFSFPLEKYLRYFCTGCGRCSRTCMAKINLKETINQLAEDTHETSNT